MNLTDFIGKDKAFVPPFHADSYGMYVFDSKNQMVLELRGYGHLRHLFSDAEIGKFSYIFANKICDLLNEEFKID